MGVSGASQINGAPWVGSSALIISLLALMLANTVVILWHRIRRYSQATRQTRTFVGEAAVVLGEGSFRKVAAISARNSRSHVATVVAAALTAFGATPLELSDLEAIDSALRASQRSRMRVSADLKLGLGSLATTASCAPFIGLLGTVFGILNAFGAIGMAKSAAMAWIALNLAEALVTTAMGLLVAIFATWSHNYVRGAWKRWKGGCRTRRWSWPHISVVIVNIVIVASSSIPLRE